MRRARAGFNVLGQKPHIIERCQEGAKGKQLIYYPAPGHYQPICVKGVDPLLRDMHISSSGANMGWDTQMSQTRVVHTADVILLTKVAPYTAKWDTRVGSLPDPCRVRWVLRNIMRWLNDIRKPIILD